MKRKKVNYILLIEDYFSDYYVFEKVDDLFDFIECNHLFDSNFQILERTNKRNSFRLLNIYEKRVILECLKLHKKY